MKAVIKTGGKQYYVEEGSIIYVEKLEGNPKDTVTFTDVLMLGNKVGNPTVPGAKVEGEIVKHGKNKKIKISTLEIANALVAKYNKENNTDFEVVDGLTTFTDDDFELIDFDEEEPEPPAPLQHPWNPLFTILYGVFNIGISFEHAWKFLGTIIS